MTWEEKVKGITIKASDLATYSSANDTCFYRYFSLLCYNKNTQTDYPQEQGVAYFEALIKEGQIQRAKTILPSLKAQYEFLITHIKLAKKYKGPVEVFRMSSYWHIGAHTNDTLCSVGCYQIEKSGIYNIYLPEGYDLSNIHKWMLKVSRLFAHFEQRGLKHPRHKQMQ
jgi:hypothetical protein